MQHLGVFISANTISKAIYQEKTENLAKEIANRALHLVYGGASTGLMGTLADTVLSLGGKVTGIIPEVLVSKEIAHSGLTETHIVSTMQERKRLLTKFSDAFIVMPGGLGTLEELFEIWNAVKIGCMNKKIGLLNVDGYFDHLMQFIGHAVKQGFISHAQASLIAISTNEDELLNLIQKQS